MKKFITLAAAAAVALTPVSVAHADAASDYKQSLECASFHVIAAVILSEGDSNSPVIEEQAMEGAAYLMYAEQVNPDADQDADLTAQVDQDMATMLSEGADIEKFITDRATMCEGLKSRM